MFMEVCIARAGGMRQCGACRSSYAGAAVMLHVRRTFSCTGISRYDARSRLSYAAMWDCPCAPGLAMAAGLDISSSCHSQLCSGERQRQLNVVVVPVVQTCCQTRSDQLAAKSLSLPRATSRSRLCGGLLSIANAIAKADAVEMQETTRKTQRRKRRAGANEIFGQVCSPVLPMKLL